MYFAHVSDLGAGRPHFILICFKDVVYSTGKIVFYDRFIFCFVFGIN